MATKTDPTAAVDDARAGTPYVDGFVIAVPKDKLDVYQRIAQTCAEVWREHGALHVAECVADDVPYGEVTSFPRAVQAQEDETVIFSWITYPSRKARDEINPKVMADPRVKDTMEQVPFDARRMIYGGFCTIVDV